MARGKARWITWWFFSLQVTLCLLLILVQGNEDTDEAYRNGRSLVLEYFLPINLPPAVDVPREREKRDIEGSGEDETLVSEINDKNEIGDDSEVDNSTQTAFVKFITDSEKENNNFTSVEGSGEVDETVENSSEIFSEDNTSSVAIIEDSEILPKLNDEVPTNETETDWLNQENSTTEGSSNETTEMIFDNSEDIDKVTEAEETTTEMSKNYTQDHYSVESEVNTTEEIATSESVISAELIPTEVSKAMTTEGIPLTTTAGDIESTTSDIKPLEGVFFKETTSAEQISTEPAEVANCSIKHTTVAEEIGVEEKTEAIIPVLATTKEAEESTVIPIVVTVKEPEETTPIAATTKQEEETTVVPVHVPVVVTDTLEKMTESHSSTSEGLPVSTTQSPTTMPPVVEEIFKETKIAQKTLEALPGNILQKENMTLGVDPLLIVTNTRIMDSEETLSSSEPKRLGAYIVIGLILLSFLSLIGYITFKKRMLKRKKQEFESHPESHDTEKALLSLCDYKDSTELEENHLKNNEITPIVVKSNSQINKFEKNTNFSSPKNLNTIANEKNIEKDNVLKSTAENLTQVIIEDCPKDVDEEKNPSNPEKLIVRTLVDQDSIPKKPIIITRGCIGVVPPLTQDNL